MEIENKSKSIITGRGGKREGSGRKAGQRNKKTQALLENIEATGLTPLAYMLQCMRDESNTKEFRLDAAKSAAPYVHAKLSSVELNGEGGGPIQHVFEYRIVDPAG